MPVPTHSPDCKTKMFPTTCPDCGDDVFFFSCTCGSKVFFDLPNYPWNPHEDRCIPYLLRIIKEIQKVPDGEVRSLIEEYSKVSGIPIPKQVQRQLDDLDRKLSNQLKIIDVPARMKSIQIIGTIISITPQVNFLKRFNYSDNQMGRAFLGKLAKEGYIEVIIRKEADSNYVSEQYHVFHKFQPFKRSVLRQNNRVIAILNSFQLPDGRTIWISDRIEPNL